MTLEEQIKFIQELTKQRTLEAIRAGDKSDAQMMVEIDALNRVGYSLMYLQDIKTMIERHVK